MIVRKAYGFAKKIKGYVGVYCRCGNVCYVKNKPDKRGQWITIECPCGSSIQTIYCGEDDYFNGTKN